MKIIALSKKPPCDVRPILGAEEIYPEMEDRAMPRDAPRNVGRVDPGRGRGRLNSHGFAE